MTPICILNLTHSDAQQNIQPAPLSFGAPQTTIRDPGAIPNDGPLILYIVGHAVPNGLLGDPNNRVLKEEDLATDIQRKRGSYPTLIIWDVCFAKSFLAIPRVDWSNNYVHIFSSQSYERSWHTGQTAGKPPRQSIFSTELEGAIITCKREGTLTWRALEGQLRAQLGQLQKPAISPQEGPPPQLFFPGGSSQAA
jgi:hypothetical protein